MSRSTNSRSMEHFKKLGYVVTKVEQYNPYDKKRHDLFGFIDSLALNQTELLGVQACGMSDRLEHLRKIRDEPRAKLWVLSGHTICLQAWRKLKVKRGGKAIKWVPKELYIDCENWNEIMGGFN